jgi:hypothetical protein
MSFITAPLHVCDTLLCPHCIGPDLPLPRGGNLFLLFSLVTSAFIHLCPQHDEGGSVWNTPVPQRYQILFLLLLETMNLCVTRGTQMTLISCLEYCCSLGRRLGASRQACLPTRLIALVHHVKRKPAISHFLSLAGLFCEHSVEFVGKILKEST